jgi:hypothetical protein
MATFWQWHRGKTVRRVTWVCGPEAVLARLVVDAHRAGAPPDQCAALFAGEVPERDIWDQLLSVPPSGGRRLVVYGAEKLTAPRNVALLAESDGLDTAYAVFVSASTDFEKENGALAPHLAVLQASKAAQLVRCCEPSKAEDRMALVADWWPGLSPNLAWDVLARCGSLERAAQACEQARLAGLDPTAAMVAVVCPAEPGGELADLLMAGNKRAAMGAARRAARGEVGAAIGLLAARLLAAEQIGDGMRDGLRPREAASRGGVDRFVASRVTPHMASYGAERIRRCRLVLVTADAAWRSGAGAGVAESLVAGW